MYGVPQAVDDRQIGTLWAPRHGLAVGLGCIYGNRDEATVVKSVQQGPSIQIDVAQEDIDSGTPKTSFSCPVAIAASRVLGRMAQVGYYCIETDGLAYRVPNTVLRFMERFDSGEACEPFEFEIATPGWKLSEFPPPWQS